MYNRYIPQQDGTYRRSRVEEPRPAPQPKKPASKEEKRPPAPPPEPAPCPPPPKQEHCPQPEKRREKDDSIGGFLQKLLPKDLDSLDLIVILLLLLLAGDCEEDRSNALLTLALYLFM